MGAADSWSTMSGDVMAALVIDGYVNIKQGVGPAEPAYAVKQLGGAR